MIEHTISDSEILRKGRLTGLTADSRAVQPGNLFAAIPGTQTDGTCYIPDAIAAGAKVILAPPHTIAPQKTGRGVILVTDPNPRRRLAKLAAKFYEAQPEMAVAVTGTNGKSSVVDFCRQLWLLLGQHGASLGTLGLRSNGTKKTSGLTTPGPVELHASLAALKSGGVKCVALEASSHGLIQNRLDGVALKAAALTNISRDHLDYHGSMESYQAAKLRLFSEVLTRGATAVVNQSIPVFSTVAKIANRRGLRLLSYGLEEGDIRCLHIRPRARGFDLDLKIMNREYAVPFPLPGLFQVENALCALGLVLACGEDPGRAVPQLTNLQGVRGRMEQAVVLPNGAVAYVDYAHTPDALETVLKALRPHVTGKLHVVFGCGGNRDKGKRPLMGEIACKLADSQIITDDNPRDENPAQIRAEIKGRCPKAKEIGDRRKAIRWAVQILKAGDAVLVAGKGHERGQIIGDHEELFDDVEVLVTAVQDLDRERAT